MSDNRMEIATRARRLVAARGEEIVSTVSGKAAGHHFQLGKFYMRVRTNNELYINDRETRLAPTVFSQREIDSTGAFHGYDIEARLLGDLRQATVLDDLADV